MAKLRYRTLRENVVDEIRMKILNREYEPGMRIVEQNLSDELGVSRGPIREALRQLEQEGLVEYVRNVGCSVKQVTLEDVYEIYLLRATYEQLAVRTYEGQLSDEDLARRKSRSEQTSESLDRIELRQYRLLFCREFGPEGSGKPTAWYS